MTESNLHFRVIQNKLIAELYKYLDTAKTELDYAWDKDVPSSQGIHTTISSFMIEVRKALIQRLTSIVRLAGS